MMLMILTANDDDADSGDGGVVARGELLHDRSMLMKL